MDFEFDGTRIVDCPDAAVAARVASAYRDHIDAILAYVHDGLSRAYPVPSGEALAAVLGVPVTDYAAWTTSYPENAVDREHVVTFEHDLDFDRLAGFRMDG